ncbi:MAG: hypothetical protein KAI53_02200 [Candidatus Aenigmarchaeota archaeon]|nr:hypothetical protein [Candidatus Aenigmarchaeota archaeon]
MIFICGGEDGLGTFLQANHVLSILKDENSNNKCKPKTHYLGNDTTHHHGAVLIRGIDGSVEERPPTGYQVNQMGSLPYQL